MRIILITILIVKTHYNYRHKESNENVIIPIFNEFENHLHHHPTSFISPPIFILLFLIIFIFLRLPHHHLYHFRCIFWKQSRSHNHHHISALSPSQFLILNTICHICTDIGRGVYLSLCLIYVSEQKHV